MPAARGAVGATTKTKAKRFAKHKKQDSMTAAPSPAETAAHIKKEEKIVRTIAVGSLMQYGEMEAMVNSFTRHMKFKRKRTILRKDQRPMRKAITYRMIADQLRYDDNEELANLLEYSIGVELPSPKPNYIPVTGPLTANLVLKRCIAEPMAALRDIDKRRSSSFFAAAGGTESFAERVIGDLFRPKDLYTNRPPKEVPANIEPTRRSEIAAINMLRAMEYKPPMYLTQPQRDLYLMINSSYWKTVTLILSMVHVFLAFWETHVFKRGTMTREELSHAGFYQSVHVIDGAILVFYSLHMFMIVQVFGGMRQFMWRADMQELLMLVVIILLGIDAALGATEEYVRPFRFLRPFMIITASETMFRAVKAATMTVVPLSKLFILLFVGMIFFAIVGLNLFSGYPDDPVEPNTFGAACFLRSNNTHYFGDFRESFLSMYVLMTSDNNPGVMWPFYTCQCSYTSFECGQEVTYEWDAGDKCGVRVGMSMIFFISYLCIAFFILGNCVLAICFVHYEESAVKLLLGCALTRRISLIHAFYMLEDNGFVYYDTFVRCMDKLTYVKNIGDSIAHYFNALDQNGDGKLDIAEFFDIVEMMSTKIYRGKSSMPSVRYLVWKESKLHDALAWLLECNLKGMPISDLIVNIFVIVNAGLASIESTRTCSIEDMTEAELINCRPTQAYFAEIITYLFVFEVLLKFAVNGPRTYFADSWNSFDFKVTVINTVALVCEYAVAEGWIAVKYRPFFGLVGCLRLVRLIRALTYIGGQEKGYYSNILRAVASAVPATSNILVLICFLCYSLACIGVEIMPHDVGSRNIARTDGFIHYLTRPEERDWSTILSGMYSMVQIMVGNTWSDVMLNNSEKDRNLAAFFLLIHFIGVFVMLNIVQSVFVYAFDILLDDGKFSGTWESDLDRLDDKIQVALQPKALRRKKHIDRLMLTRSVFDIVFRGWQANCPHIEVRKMLFRLDKHYYDDETGEQTQHKRESYGNLEDAFRKASTAVEYEFFDVDGLDVNVIDQDSLPGKIELLKEKLSEAQHAITAFRSAPDVNSDIKDKLAAESRAMLKELASTRDQMNEMRRLTKTQMTEAQQLIAADLEHVKKALAAAGDKDAQSLAHMYQEEVDRSMKLRNQVQELLGNIRVVVRVRPAIDAQEAVMQAIAAVDGISLVAEQLDDDDESQVYKYDKVLGSHASQEDLFNACQTLVHSVTDGYNVCIISYGSKDAGKSYTIEGRLDRPVDLHKIGKDEGLAYRIMRELFHIALTERQGVYDTNVSMRMFAIHNEKIIDVLRDPFSEDKVKPIKLKEIPGLGIVTENATVEEVTTLREGLDLLQTGFAQVGRLGEEDFAKNCFKVVTLHVRSTNKRTDRVYVGKLTIVVSPACNAVVKGEHGKHTQSLNALHSVLEEVRNSSKHVHYNKSKLTHLIKDSVGGSAKMMLVCNINPSHEDLANSLHTLRIASLTKSVALGKSNQVIRNESLVEVRRKLLESKRQVLKKLRVSQKDLAASFNKGQPDALSSNEQNVGVLETPVEVDEDAPDYRKSRSQTKAEARARREARREAEANPWTE